MLNQIENPVGEINALKKRNAELLEALMRLNDLLEALMRLNDLCARNQFSIPTNEVAAIIQEVILP